ncbi:MAG: hypothetical protein NC133_02570 [Prevotella sp.]|nr:hypothetical protein [Prevotella sp.]
MANEKFTPYTTEQKREYAQNFTPGERKSYRMGQRNAYSHMGNIGKQKSFYINSNLNVSDSTPTPEVVRPKQTASRKTTKK